MSVEYSKRSLISSWPAKILAYPLLFVIYVYRVTLSPVMGNGCRFYPTCSHYGYQAIYKHGAIKGGLMAAWRVLRCNPFNAGGYDPVP